MTVVVQAVGTGVRNVRVLTRDSLHPIPQWAALEGCTAALLMAEHDDAKQASGHCARACGVLTRVRSACLWRAQRACATPLPQGGAKARSSAREQRGVDDRTQRRKASKRAVRVSLWRADACAQGMPVARTACVRYASSSGRGQNRSSAHGQRDVAVCLTSSAASAFVVTVVICPLARSLVAVADRSLHVLVSLPRVWRVRSH